MDPLIERELYILDTLIQMLVLMKRRHIFLSLHPFVLQAKGKKPLFVQLVLDNIWTLYDAVVTRRWVSSSLI